jgi:alanine racemase
MDQSMYALDTIPDARLGDEVVLVGRQGDAFLSAEEVGASWGTINYDVVCGLAARVPRYYFDE